MSATLRRLLGRRRPAAPAGPPGWVDGFDDPRYWSMGLRSYGRPVVHVFRGDVNRVDVGRYCSISTGVELFVGGNHRVDWPSTWPFRELLDKPGAFERGCPSSRGDITIGSDVWLGRGCTVLSGVTIGHGAAIGARAVVSSDVRPYAIVGGNPGREVRRRFADDVVDELLALRWWDWPVEVVDAHWELFCSDDMPAFLAAARRISADLGDY